MAEPREKTLFEAPPMGEQERMVEAILFATADPVTPPGLETAFTAALRSLAGSVDQRRAIGVANRCKAESYFIERCAERYEAILERAVAGRSAR